MDWNLALSVILSGIVIVFIALVILIIAVLLVGKIMTSVQGKETPNKTQKNEKKEVTTKAVPNPPQLMKVEQGIPGEVVAAISAAVASMMGGSSNYSIKSVKRAREARPVWSLAGMMENTKPF